MISSDGKKEVFCKNHKPVNLNMTEPIMIGGNEEERKVCPLVVKVEAEEDEKGTDGVKRETREHYGKKKLSLIKTS